MKNTGSAGAALAGAALVLGCGADPAYLGVSSEITWWTDHETGDFSDWFKNNGKVWTTGGGAVAVVNSPVRSGSHSLRALSNTSDASELSAAIGVRESLTPNLACYSAWYYVPALLNANKVWLFFKFRSRTQPSDADSAVEAWDVDVVPNGDGSGSLAIHSYQTDTRTSVKNAVVPVARWFQLEACLLASSGVEGRLSIWLDDALVFELEGQPTLPSQWVEWNVGNVAEATTPATASVFADDAAISTRRLGPDYPIFWRNVQ